MAASGPATESLINRIILGPILFVSFLIALVVVDRQTSGSIFGKTGSKDGYYHSHQRKLAKRDMDDAFQIRPKVIAALCLLSVVSLAFVVWGIESIWAVWRVRV